LTLEISSLERFSELGLLNDQGKPRLNLAQYHFSHGIELELLTDLYRYWRDLNEYGVIEKSWFEDLTIKHEYKAVKCSKRGNDVYHYRVEKRLGWTKQIKNEVFFTDEDIANNKAFSQILFFTLSYNTNRCSRIEAWETIGKDYDNWIRGIRQKYGSVSVLRVWQSTQKGYPHVHGILLSRDHKFKISFKTYDPKGRPIYRIAEKEEFESGYHSFVDVCAVRTVRGALNYAVRYVTRVIDDDVDEGSVDDDNRNMAYDGKMNDLDMALMWLFRKRGYAISGDFRSALIEFIADLRNSDKKTLVQMALDGSKAEELEVWYRWLGVFGALELGITHNEWFKFLEFDPSYDKIQGS